MASEVTIKDYIEQGFRNVGSAITRVEERLTKVETRLEGLATREELNAHRAHTEAAIERLDKMLWGSALTALGAACKLLWDFVHPGAKS